MSEVAENNEVRERFVVDNDMKAEWCLSKIRKIREEQSRETLELDRQMDFYRQQKEMIASKADEDVAFFEEILRGYFQSRVDDGFVKETKTKMTYKLPTGNLVLKHREPEWMRDDAVILDWLETCEDERFVKVKKSLDWAGLKKTLTASGDGAVTADGEVVPGVVLEKRDDEFVVEVK